MKHSIDISPEAGWPKTNGMKVPEGYFENFQRRMMERIPEQPETPQVLPRTFWQKVRPYAYLAAMFMGIWLMMNIFTFTGKVDMQKASPSAGSQMIAEVVNSNTTGYVDEYVDMSDYDLYNDLYNSGFQIPEESQQKI